MKLNKLTAVLLAAVVSFCAVVAPQTKLEAQASANWNAVRAYVYNGVSDVAYVNFHTPEMSVKLYSGLTWQQLEMDMGTRLNVTESDCGAAAYAAFGNIAKSLGAVYHRTFDMDLEYYKLKSGYTKDVVATTAPIRVSMALPKGLDTSRDYAFISVKEGGSLEILGDIDAEPTTITVDASNFETWALISGPAGTFNANRFVSPTALTNVTISNYTKYVPTTVSAGSKCSYVYSIGTVTDAATVQRIVGTPKVKLEVTEQDPGTATSSLIDSVAKQIGVKNVQYYGVELRNGYNQLVPQTSQDIRVIMTLPFNFPAYADYAIAVVNMDGTVTVNRDLDLNDSTITIDTNQFRTFAVMWAPVGTFRQQ